jgi:hypothetical protein
LEVEALHRSGRTRVDDGTTVIPSAARDPWGHRKGPSLRSG